MERDKRIRYRMLLRVAEIRLADIGGTDGHTVCFTTKILRDSVKTEGAVIAEMPRGY